MPQGEEIWEAAVREVKEEAGVSNLFVVPYLLNVN